MKKITPHLWFDTQAREATEFYASVFPNSRITNITTLTDTPSGDCDIVSFELAGQPFLAISAGPYFKINPAVSFHVNCGTTAEIDALWEPLSAGGRALMPLDKYPFSERFGWVEDRFGVSWQLILGGQSETGQKIVPFLMFVGDVCGKAEEAMQFYASVFQNAPLGGAKNGATNVNVLMRYGKGQEPDREGTVTYAQFLLRGEEFRAMDSAHAHTFAFNEAISLLVPCDTQEEIDYFWGKLSADPKAEQCGWLKDKYGLSWQINPSAMDELLASDDKARVARVTQAFLQMKKFDIAELERAAAG